MWRLMPRLSNTSRDTERENPETKHTLTCEPDSLEMTSSAPARS